MQHAMNLKFRDEEAFAAEYQNEPVTEQFADERLTADQVAEKTTGRPRGEVPLAATRVTAFIDVHDKLLYWCVCAWEEDFTGYVIDYGTFPDQKRQYFTLRDATHTLAATFRGAGKEGAVQAGLEKLAAELLARPWERTDGAALHIERLLINSGYLPGVCNAVAIKAGPAVLLSKGMGLRAGNKPMASYTRRPGERHGHNWPLTRGSGKGSQAFGRECRDQAVNRLSPGAPVLERPLLLPGLGQCLQPLEVHQSCGQPALRRQDSAAPMLKQTPAQVARAPEVPFPVAASEDVKVPHHRRPMATRAKPRVKGWYIPNVSRSSEFRHVAFDANSWKTFIHARLATLAGDRGALSLFGKKPEQHRLFAEHVADAESYVITAGYGRTVHEWRPKPSKPDNHSPGSA